MSDFFSKKYRKVVTSLNNLYQISFLKFLFFANHFRHFRRRSGIDFWLTFIRTVSHFRGWQSTGVYTFTNETCNVHAWTPTNSEHFFLLLASNLPYQILNRQEGRRTRHTQVREYALYLQTICTFVTHSQAKTEWRKNFDNRFGTYRFKTWIWRQEDITYSIKINKNIEKV